MSRFVRPTLAKELTVVENAIDGAVQRHGDEAWRWAGSKANPNVVPLAWNDITVFDGEGNQRTVCAADYIRGQA